ncbi:universal stress protein [Actinomadura roseirufa]|uniref:universal stress protein n=1 Tax=Actinomadura roseirufa TaxID=2094049 RepID=UPI001040ECFD|nr:universal stress protein [Actinomadura roseirufa]
MHPCLLLVVDDSDAALAAARYAMALAHRLDAGVRAVGVPQDGPSDDRDGVRGPCSAGAFPALGHVRRLAHLEEIKLETVEIFGETAPRVLAEAEHARPSMIIVGRAPGGVAPWAARVLKEARRPVLVVPAEH